MYRALKEVGGAEAQMLPWQHTSYLSLNFLRKFETLIVSYFRIICKNDPLEIQHPYQTFKSICLKTVNMDFWLPNIHATIMIE